MRGNDVLQEKLPSKKNNVYKKERVSGGKTHFVVEKEFSESGRFFTELKISELLKDSDINTPRLLGAEQSTENRPGRLIYEFIDGDVALNALSEEVISLIAGWMKRFYEIALENTNEQWILGDIHLRNFIYDPKEQAVFGFDFEEARKGVIEEDVARLFLFITTYEPEYCEKHMKLAEHFLKAALFEFDIDKGSLIGFVQEEAERMAERRGKEVKTGRVLPIVEKAYS